MVQETVLESIDCIVQMELGTGLDSAMEVQETQHGANNVREEQVTVPESGCNEMVVQARLGEVDRIDGS
jgi:hypothetical protein